MPSSRVPCYRATLDVAQHPAVPEQAVLSVPLDQACILFHDLNRTLSLLDSFVADAPPGYALSSADQKAYDRLSKLVNALQKAVNP